jgi:predicted membrane protein
MTISAVNTAQLLLLLFLFTLLAKFAACTAVALFKFALWQHKTKEIQFPYKSPHTMWKLMHFSVKRPDMSVTLNMTGGKHHVMDENSYQLQHSKYEKIQIQQDIGLFSEVNTLLILCKNLYSV